MVEMMAMEGPRLARIDRVKGERDAGHVWHDYGVPHRAVEGLAIDGDDLEVMPMKMHGVGHHRHVAHFDEHAVSFCNGERRV